MGSLSGCTMATSSVEPRPAQAPTAAPSGRRSRVPSWVLLTFALAGTFAAQARTLSFYFFQDDYVPFGEIVKNGDWVYLKQLLLARDLTPNWRVIPGVMYLLNYELFGMTPLPMHIALLALHLGTVALLFRAVLRTTGHRWAGFAAAIVFGLQPSYAGTLGQVASVPHVAAAFFLAAALNAIIECGSRDTHTHAWWGVSIGLYVLALMSNESMAVMVPAFALALFVFDRRGDGRVRRGIVRALPFAALGIIVVLAVKVCDCTEASSVYGTDNAPRAFLIYAGRLMYPIGLEPPTYIDAPHLYASMALLALAGWMLAFGPAIGRVGAVWMLLAIVPHIFVVTHTANRFTYLATPGFAMLAAGYAIVFERYAPRVRAALPASAGIAAVVILPWYAMQTHLQNEPWRQTTSDWQLLHDELQRVYPQAPAGSRVEVIGGPLTHPLDQFFVMPALGYTIWNPSVTLQTFAPDDPYAAKVRASGNPYAAEFWAGRLVPLRP